MKPLALLLLVAACGDNADVAGSYTIGITNRDNGCMFANYTVGEQTTNVQAVVTQEGDNLTLTVQGLAGLFVSGVLGSNVFIGDVDGEDVSLAITGTAMITTNGCMHTVNSTIDATSEGDTLSGRIEYRAAGTGDPACAALVGCVTAQDFNGTRPPR